MAKNRLNLDFSLETTEERKNFIDTYLQSINFAPTAGELDTMAAYILWGTDDGVCAAKTKDFTVETKHKTWAKKSDESLDALLEQPTFNEASFSQCAPTKIVKEKFSRSDALRDCPDSLKPQFESLFQQIDRLDLEIGLYEELVGKRDKPPRDEIMEKFSGEEIFAARARVADLSQHDYLKKRHLIKELRDTQYTLRDSYTNIMLRPFPQPLLEEEKIIFDETIQVFPLGIKENSPLIFRDFDTLIPQSFTEEELGKVSHFLWTKKNEIRNNFHFDFENEEHIGFLLEFYLDLAVDHKSLTDTLDYYIKIAKLSDAQREILEMKIQKKTNQEIRLYINEKYQKNYMVNYISTIFRQKIIPAIVAAVSYHKEVVENIFFEENFKKCSCCGKVLLISEHNFMHKARSKDGYSARCKRCEKEKRK